MLGYFNLPSEQWGLNNASSDSTTLDSLFVDMFAVHDLVQMVQVPSYFSSGSVMDLILCSQEERVGMCEVLPLFPVCFHGVAASTNLFQNNVNDIHCMTVIEEEKLWTRGDYDSMANFLETVNWVF